MFSTLLGSAAGDLALTVGARGGIYLAGGVCLRLGPLFDRARSGAGSSTRAACEPSWSRFRPGSCCAATPV